MNGNAWKCNKMHGNALKFMEMQGNAGHGKINISALHGATGWLPIFALVRFTPVKSTFSVAGGAVGCCLVAPMSKLTMSNSTLCVAGRRGLVSDCPHVQTYHSKINILCCRGAVGW